MCFAAVGGGASSLAMMMAGVAFTSLTVLVGGSGTMFTAWVGSLRLDIGRGSSGLASGVLSVFCVNRMSEHGIFHGVGDMTHLKRYKQASILS